VIRLKIRQKLNLCSMLSALRYQQPNLILLHTNCIPNGRYWKIFQKAAGDTLMIIRRSPPQEIFGEKFTVSATFYVEFHWRNCEGRG